MPKLSGEKLLKTAINQIIRHPETWDQSAWHSDCGTKHCLAGWCQILSGKRPNKETALEDARKALRISLEEARRLFRTSCPLVEMYQFAENFSLDGYNRHGYDRDGYGRDGYNRDGYSRDGEKLKPFDV